MSMTKAEEMLELVDEEALTDFLYEIQNYSDAKEKAKLLWPRLAAQSDAQPLAVHDPKLAALRPDLAAQSDAQPPTVREPSREELIESIRYAIGKISMHIDSYHDFDYAPHQVPPELEELRRLQHHLEGSLISAIGQIAALSVLPGDQAREATIEECAKLIRFCGECDCPRMSQDAIRALSSEVKKS